MTIETLLENESLGITEEGKVWLTLESKSGLVYRRMLTPDPDGVDQGEFIIVKGEEEVLIDFINAIRANMKKSLLKKLYDGLDMTGAIKGNWCIIAEGGCLKMVPWDEKYIPPNGYKGGPRKEKATKEVEDNTVISVFDEIMKYRDRQGNELPELKWCEPIRNVLSKRINQHLTLQTKKKTKEIKTIDFSGVDMTQKELESLLNAFCFIHPNIKVGDYLSFANLPSSLGNLTEVVDIVSPYANITCGVEYPVAA